MHYKDPRDSRSVVGTGEHGFMKDYQELKNLKVLIVEDEDNAREAILSLLKRRVGKVIGCANGREGLKAFSEFLPDIVIADLMMPVMGGIEMVAEMREQYKGHRFRVMILTAMDDPETIIHAVDAGIDKYVLKPVKMPELMEALSEVAGKFHKTNPVLSLSEEGRFILQDKIKRSIASYLKKSSGKGPREVRVALNPDVIEITALEILTPMEQSIIVDNHNHSVVEYSREIYFTANADKFCQVIREASGVLCTMRESRVNVSQDRVKLIFDVTGCE